MANVKKTAKDNQAIIVIVLLCVAALLFLYFFWPSGCKYLNPNPRVEADSEKCDGFLVWDQSDCEEIVTEATKDNPEATQVNACKWVSEDCDDYDCPPGYIRKRDPICAASEQCEKNDCCVPQSNHKTCADTNADGVIDNYSCDTGHTLKTDPETLNCPNDQCTQGFCCNPVAPPANRTCANALGDNSPFSDCSSLAGYSLKSSLGGTTCSSAGCTAQDCCDPPTTCQSVVDQQNFCGGQSQMVNSPANQLCATTACTQGECCTGAPIPQSGKYDFIRGNQPTNECTDLKWNTESGTRASEANTQQCNISDNQFCDSCKCNNNYQYHAGDNTKWRCSGFKPYTIIAYGKHPNGTLDAPDGIHARPAACSGGVESGCDTTDPVIIDNCATLCSETSECTHFWVYTSGSTDAGRCILKRNAGDEGDDYESLNRDGLDNPNGYWVKMDDKDTYPPCEGEQISSCGLKLNQTDCEGETPPDWANGLGPRNVAWTMYDDEAIQCQWSTGADGDKHCNIWPSSSFDQYVTYYPAKGYRKLCKPPS